MHNHKKTNTRVIARHNLCMKKAKILRFIQMLQASITLILLQYLVLIANIAVILCFEIYFCIIHPGD